MTRPNPVRRGKSPTAGFESPAVGGAVVSLGHDAPSQPAPPKYRVHSDVALSEEHTVTLILFYVAFMIAGDLAAYLLGLQASEPARFPGPLFLISLGLVGARSLGDYTESRHIKCEMKAPWMNPGVRELAALSALAALGCGLAAGQGDLLFVALFGAASIVTIIETIRRLR